MSTDAVRSSQTLRELALLQGWFAQTCMRIRWDGDGPTDLG
ncbi:hypothetical protein ACFVT2_36800 [Streptomyces sp. NPDC058000]